MFKETPASLNSLAKRKLVYGIGVNDATYTVTTKVGNKVYVCPYYTKWKSMLCRCYNPRYLEKQPTYIGCTVISDWLIFSNFKAWMITKDWKDKVLDKDFIYLCNKIYSPETCIFITQELNNLFTVDRNNKTNLPVGVHYNKLLERFIATISIKGKQKTIGRFKTVYFASKAYKQSRKEYIQLIAEENKTDLKLYNAIINHI